MEPLLHWIIPTVILLAFFPQLNRKKVLLLSPLTWIVDFDKFLPGHHRVIFYNIFFAAIILIILYKCLDKTYFYVGTYFFLSHYLFDLSFPGIALFWPLIKSLYYLDFNITYDNHWIFDFRAGSVPIGGGIEEPSYYMYTQAFLIVILLGITTLLWYKTRKQQ
ncbi:MAG: hypothetical protein Q7R96_00645 [Nanoarchaeota archaeon]|nr:hypothetical protein [Nanoarchaeota archaeon]